MDTQGATLTVCQDLKISAGLGGFDDAESIFLAGDGQVSSVVTGDLQEDSGVGAAFVGLSGRVQKAWAKAETGGDVHAVAHGVADALELVFVRGVHLDVSRSE